MRYRSQGQGAEVAENQLTNLLGAIALKFKEQDEPLLICSRT